MHEMFKKFLEVSSGGRSDDKNEMGIVGINADGEIESAGAKPPKAVLDLVEALKKSGMERKEPGPELSAEEKVARLRAVGDRFIAAACRFNVGDLVTPMESSPVRGSGEPHLVVEVRDVIYEDDPLTENMEYGSSSWGVRPDMRIIGFANEATFGAHWTESPYWEAWTAKPD